MARHVWASEWNYIKTDTAQRVERALRHAISQGMTDFEELCRFTCYYMERCRQDRYTSPKTFWQSCIGGKHRYQKGTNKNNYLKGGMLILSSMHRFVELDKGAPPNAVLDKILESKNVTGYEEYEDEVVQQPQQPNGWCGEGCTCYNPPNQT